MQFPLTHIKLSQGFDEQEKRKKNIEKKKKYRCFIFDRCSYKIILQQRSITFDQKYPYQSMGANLLSKKIKKPEHLGSVARVGNYVKRLVLTKSIGNCIPIYYIEKVADIITSTILIVEVICMLPDI